MFHLEFMGGHCPKTASNFALVYREAGRRQEALQLMERVVEARKRTLGDEHPDIETSIHTLHSIGFEKVFSKHHRNIPTPSET